MSVRMYSLSGRIRRELMCNGGINRVCFLRFGSTFAMELIWKSWIRGEMGSGKSRGYAVVGRGLYAMA